MDLLTYCTSRGTGTPNCPELASIAAKARCSAATLYLIARGHKVCGPKLANKVSLATGNKVKPQDLRPDIFGVQKSRSHKKAA